MRNFLFAFVMIVFAYICSGCGPKQAAPYLNEDRALLVGKADCIIPGWFADRHNKAKLQLFRLNSDGTRTFTATITSEYSVLAVQPGVYGLSKTFFEVESGLTYSPSGYVAQGKPYHAPLFERDFWRQTEVEQIAQQRALAPEFFGIIKVEPHDALYYGSLTLDIATNSKMPMVVVTREKYMAEAALRQKYPAQVGQMKDGGFIGAAFLLGKIRESR